MSRETEYVTPSGRAPLWLWVILASVLAGGVALVLFVMAEERKTVAPQLTPAEQERLFSDIETDPVDPDPEKGSAAPDENAQPLLVPSR